MIEVTIIVVNRLELKKRERVINCEGKCSTCCWKEVMIARVGAIFIAALRCAACIWTKGYAGN